MFRVTVAVLIVSAAALCQPLPNPFVVLQSEPAVSMVGPRVCLRDTSIADVFWVKAEVRGQQYIEHAVVSLTQRQLISGPEVLQNTDVWAQQIGDVISRGADGWLSILYEETPGPYTATRYNRTWLARGQDSMLAHASLDSGFVVGWPNPPQCDTAHTNSAFRIVNRMGGGWILSWIRNGCYLITPPATEPDNRIHLTWLSPSYAIERRSSCAQYGYLYGPTDARCASIDHDTLLVLSLQEMWNWDMEPAQLLWQPADEYGFPHVELPCSTVYAEFRQTRAGRFLALTGGDLWGQHLPKRLVEIGTSGSCTTLGTYAMPSYDAIAYHPDYGFAILSVTSSYILLSRIDTTGSEVQPLGVFYERDADHVIVQADVTLADDGRVVVLWTERAETSSDTSILKAAWVNWNTFLGADNPHFISPPSSFSLSAFPNPFNSELEIRYDVPRTQKVELAVYNLLGQKVTTLFEGMKAAGTHHEVWSPRGGSGIYFVTLRSADAVRTSKVVYLR